MPSVVTFRLKRPKLSQESKYPTMLTLIHDSDSILKKQQQRRRILLNWRRKILPLPQRKREMLILNRIKQPKMCQQWRERKQVMIKTLLPKFFKSQGKKDHPNQNKPMSKMRSEEHTSE